ncbi:unnamed protein product [Toxocara canis]|uniref:Transmembrane protein n=1 Tax=Toxocara canis TaxID=6265 RepID=A0A183VHG7_TOXCA|nr:unnamed protein product [Toxocara canis]
MKICRHDDILIRTIRWISERDPVEAARQLLGWEDIQSAAKIGDALGIRCSNRKPEELTLKEPRERDEDIVFSASKITEERRNEIVLRQLGLGWTLGKATHAWKAEGDTSDMINEIGGSLEEASGKLEKGLEEVIAHWKLGVFGAAATILAVGGLFLMIYFQVWCRVGATIRRTNRRRNQQMEMRNVFPLWTTVRAVRLTGAHERTIVSTK